MGNCLKPQSSKKYAPDADTDDYVGDDWGSPATEGDFVAKNGGGSGKITEVKIKITKKQLEKLLGKVDVREVRVEEVLAQLMSHGQGFQAHQRSWRPALQSIPEVN